MAQAKALKKVISIKQKELRLIKKDILLELQGIRAEYATKARGAGSGGSALFTFLGKRGIAGRYRADVKHSLKQQPDRVIEPYEKVKAMIDDMIIQLDQAKLRLDVFMVEWRRDEDGEGIEGESVVEIGRLADSSPDRRPTDSLRSPKLLFLVVISILGLLAMLAAVGAL